MIRVHRLKGEPFVVNADLIETIEATPDTVLRLVDGRRALVAETPDQVIDQIVRFRAAVLCAADRLRHGGSGQAERRHLTALPTDED